MATPNTDKAPARTPNPLGQKPRTEGEEKAAWMRRLRRWKRKALLSVGAEAVASMMKEASALSAADVADDK